MDDDMITYSCNTNRFKIYVDKQRMPNYAAFPIFYGRYIF